MNGWISVTERLPRDNPRRVYLVCYHNGLHRTPKGVKGVKRTARVIREAVYSGGAWRFITPHDKTRLSERVTHWMRFPSLPPRRSVLVRCHSEPKA
jgi:hypothetical protein